MVDIFFTARVGKLNLDNVKGDESDDTDCHFRS
jgi:hypothetical protein